MIESKKYPWIVVGLLWVVALLNYMDRQMLSTMKPSMMVDIIELQTATNFGRLMAVFLWIYGCMSPVAGMIADRVSKKWLIIGSLFVWSAVTFSMGYAKTFDQLYWLRAIMGVSEALYIPAGLALIAEFHDSKTRSLAVGIHMTGLYMGQALGGSMAGNGRLILETKVDKLKLQNLFKTPIHFSNHGYQGYKPCFRKPRATGALSWTNTTACSSAPCLKMAVLPTRNWRAP